MSFYRNAVWFVKGLSEYTKGGYLSAAKKFNADDLEVSCKGKSYMITGANSGIGKQVRFRVRKWVWYRFPEMQIVDRVELPSSNSSHVPFSWFAA